MSTILTIGGSPVDIVANNLRLSLSLRYDAYSTLVFTRRGGPLPVLPDPWQGKAMSLSVDGVTVFAGDCMDRDTPFGDCGWSPPYCCTDLKFRADRIPFTDSNTGTDAAAYNLSPEDPVSIPGRQGRTVGQILQDALSGLTLATALQARGIGNYSISGSTVTLPAPTLSDLSAMTIIPQRGVYVGGERSYSAIAAFCRQWAPNHLVWIDPATGNWRFFDKRTFTNHTLTMGTDKVLPTPLSRRLSECFTRVVIRGQPIAEPKLVSLTNGGLAEDFAWGSYATSSAAKAAWTPAVSQADASAKDSGSCTVPNTTTVTISASDDATRNWIANFWDQTATGAHGVVQLFYSPGSGINMFVSRRIVANTALSAGGSSSLTVDMALPATNYTKYLIYGVTSGAGYVYKKYKVVDTTIAGAMARMFTYPQPFVNANQNQETLTSFPSASVCWSTSGSPPYELESPVGITIDPSSGHIYTLQPTWVVAGNREPSDVRALLAINTGVMTAIKPSSGYQGTANSVDGLQETLTLTLGQWRDPINQSAMDAYAQEVLDSVKDAIIEGDVVYLGLYNTALTPGHAISVAGNGYTTGWESAALPILSVDLAWSPGNGQRWTTSMHCSNRRAALSSEAFLKPDRLVANALAMVGGESGVGNIMANAALAANPAYQAAMGQMAYAQSMSDQANAYGQRAAMDAINRQMAGPDYGQQGYDAPDYSAMMDDGRTGVNRYRPRTDQQRVEAGRAQIRAEREQRQARAERVRAEDDARGLDASEGIDDASLRRQANNGRMTRRRPQPIDPIASEMRRTAVSNSVSPTARRRAEALRKDRETQDIQASAEARQFDQTEGIDPQSEARRGEEQARSDAEDARFRDRSAPDMGGAG